jgi:hypothetical protein
MVRSELPTKVEFRINLRAAIAAAIRRASSV